MNTTCLSEREVVGALREMDRVIRRKFLPAKLPKSLGAGVVRKGFSSSADADALLRTAATSSDPMQIRGAVAKLFNFGIGLSGMNADEMRASARDLLGYSR
jgi:hypothetical protein